MYSRLSIAFVTTSSLRIPNSMLPFGLMPRSTMLPGGGAICAKVSFTSREGPFCATTGASAPCTPGITCPTCGFCSVWAATAGSALISGCVAGVACVMKEGNALIPIATAQIQNSFLFIALSSLLSQSLIRWLCRFAPLRAARNKRYNPETREVSTRNMPFTEEGANSARWR